MEFRTEVNISPSENRISYDSQILFMGSCFAENIGSKMKELHFRVDLNPFGINYNPSSLSRNLWALLSGKQYTKKDLHKANEKWFSFDHHSQFSAGDPGTCLEQINERIRFSRDRLLGESLDYLAEGSERTIDTHVKNLRAKLGNPGWIETVRGWGYRFSGKRN